MGSLEAGLEAGPRAKVLRGSACLGHPRPSKRSLEAGLEAGPRAKMLSGCTLFGHPRPAGFRLFKILINETHTGLDGPQAPEPPPPPPGSLAAL